LAGPGVWLPRASHFYPAGALLGADPGDPEEALLVPGSLRGLGRRLGPGIWHLLLPVPLLAALHRLALGPLLEPLRAFEAGVL